LKRAICAIGTGNLGMAAIMGLAELGWAVNAYDNSSDRIRKLQSGLMVDRDADAQDALQMHLESGRVAFFETLADATRGCDLIIVSIGTPARGDGSVELATLGTMIDALTNLRLTTWPTVVIRSNVPPGTSDQLAEKVEHWGELVYAAEASCEGLTARDFISPGRIVIGTDNANAAVPYIVMTTRCNAELISCGANAFLALKTSFANEIANLCDALGATSDDVLRGIGYDQRIGSQFLNPSLGFSDPLFEQDVKTIERVAMKHNVGSGLFSATLRVNEAQLSRIVDLLEDAAGSIDGSTIGVWGMAKAGRDVRDSHAIRVIEILAERGAAVIAYDPSVHVAQLPKGSRLVSTALEAARCDVLLVLTKWPEFRDISPRRYASLIRFRVVIDGCNVLDADRVGCADLTYRGVGRAVTGITQTLPLLAAL
jgi:UDPglucose 6-dehydrogenase